MRLRLTLALAVLAAAAAPGRAHFGMLLPESATGRKGQTTTFLYLWGHPFEHQMFDAPQPVSVTVRTPEGKEGDLTRALEKVTVAAGKGKTVTAYRFRFKPMQRGDYVLVLRARPVWMEEDRHFLEDTIKVVLHVQAQVGWDQPAGHDLELVPLTRPYGLQPGMVFQARVKQHTKGDAPLADTLVEVERYNTAPPEKLPPDEFITRTVKTDPNGVATTTLTEPGWWCLAVGRDAGTRQRDGKAYPVRQRGILWVFVHPAPGPGQGVRSSP